MGAGRLRTDVLFEWKVCLCSDWVWPYLVVMGPDLCIETLSDVTWPDGDTERFVGGFYCLPGRS